MDSFNFCDIFPNSVFFPVFITTAFPYPPTTEVPMKRTFFLLFKGVSGGKTSGSFSTGKGSPVKIASFTKRSLDSKIRQSAGTISPAEITTISPGTTSSTGISFLTPFLITEAVIFTRERSFLTVSVAPFSCQNPKIPLIKTMKRIITASALSSV